MKTQETTKHEIVNDDTVFVGTAVEIVLQMRDQAYFERGIQLEAYLEQLPGFIHAFSGDTIKLAGDSFEDSSESFIQELIRIGYFKEA